MSVKPFNSAAEKYLKAMDLTKGQEVVRSSVQKYASCGYLQYFAYLVQDLFLSCLGKTSDWQKAKNSLIGRVSGTLDPKSAAAWAEEILSSCYEAQLLEEHDSWIDTHIERLTAQREGQQPSETPGPSVDSQTPAQAYVEIWRNSDAVFRVEPTASQHQAAADHYHLIRGE
jgi:hypothetical protein